MTGPEGSGERRPNEGSGLSLRLKVELWLALVFMAVSFGAGLIVGNLGGSSQDAEAPVVEAPSADVLPEAPPLTEEELEGELPPGHPPLGAQTEAPEPKPEDEQTGGRVDEESGGSPPATPPTSP